MTIWQLIRALAQRGYTLEMGPHHGYRGYYAQFRPQVEYETCDECGQNLLADSWNIAGHGITPHRAVIMAAKIALGKPVIIPPHEEFR